VAPSSSVTMSPSAGRVARARTGGSGDDPTSKFTNLDIEAVTSDGRAKTNARVYLTWPLGLIAFGLLLWEILDLMRADRRLRLLMGRGR